MHKLQFCMLLGDNSVIDTINTTVLKSMASASSSWCDIHCDSFMVFVIKAFTRFGNQINVEDSL